MGAALEKYVTDSKTNTHAVSLNIGHRLLGLRSFTKDVIDLPINLAWSFLFLHQIVYQKIAESYPEEMGVRHINPQTLKSYVNLDLDSLAQLSEKSNSTSKDTKENRKGYKV
jgi:hypothetical protein